MNGETCSYERAIVTAVRSGIFTEDLREHLAECSGCREAREAARLLHSAIASDPAGPLPDPRKIYRMATDPRLVRPHPVACV